MNRVDSAHWAQRTRWVLMGAAAFSAYATIASAASPGPDASATPAGGDVIVTARHRQESLQKVPIAVSVVTGAQARAQNLNNLQDISKAVPAIDFRTGASNKDRTLFVRGIGTISTSPGVEPSVSMVIDGVVMGRPGMATPDLLDIDHIEILQGPQGTLFGKNASAGVINIVTENPTAIPHAFVEGSYFEGNEYRLKGGVSGPILGDNLEGLISGFYGHYDGNVRDVNDGKLENGYTHEGVRGKLIARPSDNLTLTLAGDYTDSTDTTPTGVFSSISQIVFPTSAINTNANIGALLTGVGITPSADNKTIDTNVHSHVHDQNGGVSLQADWKVLGDYTVTSITAYRDWENLQFQDFDMLPFATLSLPQGKDTGHLSYNQQSEELRIASPKGQFIDYVAGLYWLRAEDNEIYERDDVTNVGGVLTPNTGIAHYGTLENNFAVFGEADINFTPQFRAIVGYREIWDWLSYYHRRVSTSPVAITGIAPTTVNPQPGSGLPSSVEDTGYADRFGVQYDVTPNLMGYATYSRGYKGPAFNVFFNMVPPNNDAPLAPETSNAYEIGAKGSFFDQRLRANVAWFDTEFQNYQANSVQLIGGAPVTNLINAGSVSTRGIEGDFTATPIQPLTANFNFVYDDARVLNFPCPAGAAATCHINGYVLPFAPKWKLHAQGDYRIPTSSIFDVDLETDYNYQTATQYSLSETRNTIQPAYGIWNASIALIGKDNWTARVLVKNILNQHYSSFLANGTDGGTIRWVPRDDDRYFGVDLRKEF
jgi:iron complex outermembrane receptor protein